MGNSASRPVVFPILLVLLLAGNIFAACQLLASGAEFLKRMPQLTPAGLAVLRFLPLLNIVSLGGIWFWKRWGIVSAFALGVVTIGFDVVFGIWYHLAVAASSVILLGIGAAWHRERFR